MLSNCVTALPAGRSARLNMSRHVWTELPKSNRQVQAWAWLDSDHAIAQARALDARRQSGAPIGPLHGLPVGLKDVIDTAKIPSENGTVLDKGRVPEDDAVLVSRLKAAGAIIMGKTVSTELAFMHPSKTRNPHNPSHTPGGSSSGSAAAVAAAMVPLAVGTQTGGFGHSTGFFLRGGRVQADFWCDCPNRRSKPKPEP